MTQRVHRPRKVQLAVPGFSERMIRKSAEAGSDHVFLDLEDATAPNAKDDARKLVVELLNELDFGRTVRCVRINDLKTRWAYKDIVDLVKGAGDRLDTIMLPKAESARDIWFVETLLEQLELDLGLKRRIGIEALVETAAGMMNVAEIAGSSPRLEALIFGVGDFTASQKMDPSVLHGSSGYPGDVWHYGRYQLITACRAHDIDAIDGPFPNFKDVDGYREECQRGFTLGATGKWAIHPSQVPIALAVFTPPAEAVEKAQAMIDAYRKAEAEGLGAIQVDGELLDAASVRILQNVLDRAGRQ